MKIFNAVADATIIPKFYEKTHLKLNIVVSYAYLKGNGVKLTRIYREMIESLFLDSGAYTVNFKKVNISLYEYRLFYRKFGHLFDEVFNLDDDFDDPDHNQTNLIYLKENLPQRLKPPIPVVHDKADPVQEFEDYVEMGHNFIALGSNMPKKHLDTIWNKFPTVKKHIFGKLDRKMLQEYMPDSADASTWSLAVGFGRIYWWDPEDQKEVVIDLGERNKKDPDNRTDLNSFHHKAQFEQFLQDTFAFDSTYLMTNYAAKQLVNLYFFKRLEEVINAQVK